MTDSEMRELDAFIAEHVMAYKRGHPGGCKTEYWQPPPYKFGVIPVEKLPRFTTDLAASFQVLEKCIEGGYTPLLSHAFHSNEQREMFTCKNGDLGDEYAIGETLPLAIALFAKKLSS